MQKDLLTQTLAFNIIHPKTKDPNIFSLVIDGKITQLNKMLQTIKQDSIVNSKDPEGKTPLFYACYFNFQNIVMYLLMKGADPFLITQSGINVFHICCYRGHLECVQIIYHYLRHKSNMEYTEKLKQSQRKYSFKKSDVQLGQLLSSDKHLKQTQQRFAQFQKEVHEYYTQFLEQLRFYYQKSVSIQDQFMKNPVHYASLSKYTKCLQTSKFLLLYRLQLPEWDFFLSLFQEVQLLDFSSDKKVDPRQYVHLNDQCQNFLEKHIQEQMVYNFYKSIKELQKELVNQQDQDGYSPMHIASFSGDFAAIQFYLGLKGDPKLRCRINKYDVLEYAQNDQVRKYLTDLKNAAKEGDEKSFQLLVNCGQLLNGKATIYGIAPVHNAIAYTHNSQKSGMLDAILNLEIDVNVPDTNGWTPLHHAAFYNEVNALQQLIDRGANINAYSNRGYFPIHVAAQNNSHQAIKLLKEQGANPNCIDDQQCTPLHHAAKKGFKQSVEVLFNLGADIYAQDNRQWTALHYAAFYMHKDVVHQLCRFDCDEDKLQMMRTSKGQIAKDLITNSEVKFAFETLWGAAKNGNLDIVRKLVTLKHDINEQTYKFKFTPLILATKGNHNLIVKFLLAQGADKTISDKYGLTATEYAQKQQNFRLFNLINDSQ
ncbi:hypothetical protein pb186bvf_011629 [Paramecium bursaria]